jgi:hypothetical protein
MNGNIAGLLGGLVVVLLIANGKIGPLWKSITTKSVDAAEALPPAVASIPGRITGDTSTQNVPGPVDGPPLPSTAAPITKPVYAGNKLTLFPIPVAGSNPAFDSVAFNWPAGYDAEWEAFKACYQAHGSITDCVVLSAAGKG